MRHLVANSRNGMPIYVDLIYSAAAREIAKQPRLLRLVEEALKQKTVRGTDVRFEYNAGRTVGYSHIVETAETDSVLYAQCTKESVFSRFVKNKKPIATQHVSVTIRHAADGSYEVLDAWIGQLHPPLPGSDNELPESKDFWMRHAMILTDQSLQHRTATTVSPY